MKHRTQKRPGSCFGPRSSMQFVLLPRRPRVKPSGAPYSSRNLEPENGIRTDPMQAGIRAGKGEQRNITTETVDSTHRVRRHIPVPPFVLFWSDEPKRNAPLPFTYITVCLYNDEKDLSSRRGAKFRGGSQASPIHEDHRQFDDTSFKDDNETVRNELDATERKDARRHSHLLGRESVCVKPPALFPRGSFLSKNNRTTAKGGRREKRVVFRRFQGSPTSPGAVFGTQTASLTLTTVDGTMQERLIAQKIGVCRASRRRMSSGGGHGLQIRCGAGNRPGWVRFPRVSANQTLLPSGPKCVFAPTSFVSHRTMLFTKMIVLFQIIVDKR